MTETQSLERLQPEHSVERDTFEGPVLIPVVDGQPLKSGLRTVSGSIPAHVLVRTHKIPYRDALRKTGYQRRPQDARINKLMMQLRKKRVDIPTSILLNVRGPLAKRILVERDGQLFLRIDQDNIDELSFYVVDGQHRVLALVRLCIDEPTAWSEFKLQFVLMLGAPEEEELNQFFVVNSTAKSVRTDLAIDLMKQRADLDGRVMEEA